jgi:hypothetical protein
VHYKTNRQNHDFQIAYFLAGSCQTADAAYSLLCDLAEDRSNALKSFKAYSLRDKAKVIRAERIMASFVDPHSGEIMENNRDEPDYLEALANVEELRALADTTQKNYDAAVAELAFIEKCKASLLPFRKYAHLPDAQAHEAAQHDEWKMQLVHTAENHLLSTGNIPHDHWGTMRMHPEYSSYIMPAIAQFEQLRLEANGAAGPAQQKIAAAQIAERLNAKTFTLPPLLEAPKLPGESNVENPVDDQGADRI